MVKVHVIPAWEVTKPSDPLHRGGLVYTQKIALDQLAAGCDIRYAPQRRVCVMDRPESEREMEGCYMCAREEDGS